METPQQALTQASDLRTQLWKSPLGGLVPLRR